MLLDGKVEKFLAVARCGSMSQAAKELYVSQPSLTTQIRKLEEEVGFPLFDRLPQGVTLTKTGSILYEAVQRAEGICARAVADGRSLASADGARVIIGILTSREACMLNPALDALRAIQPEIDIEFAIVPHAFEKRRQMLLDGLIDCFLYGMRESDLGSDLRLFSFFTTGECLAMPPDYDLAQKSTIEPGDLSERTIYFPKEDYSISPTKSLREHLMEEHPGINLHEQVIDAAFMQTLPYLKIPLVSLERIMRNVPGIAVVPLKSAVMPAHYGLVYPKNHRESLDFLLNCLPACVMP